MGSPFNRIKTMSNPTEIPFGQGGARVPSSLVQKGLQFANNMGLDALTALVKTLIEQQIPALPIASAETLGGVKVGDGLQISDGGVLSSSGGGSQAGGVSIKLDNIASGPKHINLPDGVADSISGIWNEINSRYEYYPKISEVVLSLITDNNEVVKEVIDRSISGQLPGITTLSDHVMYFGCLGISQIAVNSFEVIVMVQDTQDITLWHFALIEY